MNYNQSTRQRLVDMILGMKIKTGVLNSATYLVSAKQTELFTLKGAILVMQLYLEIITDCSAHAAQVVFNATFSTPSILAAPMGTKCAALTSLARGGRVTWMGGALATAAVITITPGITLTCVNPQIIGGVDFVGTIGTLGSDASLNAGTFIAVLRYVPMYPDSYAEALL